MVQVRPFLPGWFCRLWQKRLRPAPQRSLSTAGKYSPTAIFKVDQSLVSDYDGKQLSFALDGGWDFNKNGWTFGPTFRVNYVDVDVDAFDEILMNSDIPPALGTVGWAVHIDDQSYKSLQPAIGFEFSKAISKERRAGWPAQPTGRWRWPGLRAWKAASSLQLQIQTWHPYKSYAMNLHLLLVNLPADTRRWISSKGDRRAYQIYPRWISSCKY